MIGIVGAIALVLGIFFFRACGTYVDTGIGLGEFVDRLGHAVGYVLMPLGAAMLGIAGLLMWLALRKRSARSA